MNLLLRLGALGALSFSTLPAQSPLATPFDGTISTTSAAALYFDLDVRDPNGITLAALELHLHSALGTAGQVEIYTTPNSYFGALSDPEPWNLVHVGAATSAGPLARTPLALGAGLFLPPGTVGVAVVGAGLQQRYTAGRACAPGGTPGSCANSSFASAELAFAGGAMTRAAFSGVVFSQAIWNGALHYVPGNATLPRAEVRPFGMGGYASLYRDFADAATAQLGLEGRALRLAPEGGGYRVSSTSASYFAPGRNAVPVFASRVDDHEIPIAPSQPLPTPEGPQPILRVHSNGIVTWGTTGATTFPGTVSYRPTATGFLGGNRSGFYAWHDYNEAELGSGRILREELQWNGQRLLLLTWEEVESFASPEGANPGTLQLQLDLTSGVVTILWPHVDANTSSLTGSAHLVGYKTAGVRVDPGAIDFDIDLPLLTASNDAAAHCSASAPLLGATWQLFASSHDPSVFVAVFVLGSSALGGPGLDLSGAGAPGQRLYVLPDFGSYVALVGQGFGQLEIPVPLRGELAGIEVHAQALTPTAQNPLGWASSRGITARLGF